MTLATFCPFVFKIFQNVGKNNFQVNKFGIQECYYYVQKRYNNVFNNPSRVLFTKSELSKNNFYFIPERLYSPPLKKTALRADGNSSFAFEALNVGGNC